MFALSDFESLETIQLERYCQKSRIFDINVYEKEHQFICLQNNLQDFSGGPVVKSPCCQCRGASSIPGGGTRIPYAMWCNQKKIPTAESRVNKVLEVFVLPSIAMIYISVQLVRLRI